MKPMFPQQYVRFVWNVHVQDSPLKRNLRTIWAALPTVAGLATPLSSRRTAKWLWTVMVVPSYASDRTTKQKVQYNFRTVDNQNMHIFNSTNLNGCLGFLIHPICLLPRHHTKIDAFGRTNVIEIAGNALAHIDLCDGSGSVAELTLSPAGHLTQIIFHADGHITANWEIKRSRRSVGALWTSVVTTRTTHTILRRW